MKKELFIILGFLVLVGAAFIFATAPEGVSWHPTLYANYIEVDPDCDAGGIKIGDDSWIYDDSCSAESSGQTLVIKSYDLIKLQSGESADLFITPNGYLGIGKLPTASLDIAEDPQGQPAIKFPDGSSQNTGLPICDEGQTIIMTAGGYWDCAPFQFDSANCGNGAIENDEECDDGNTISGDGCSEYCIIEDNDGGYPPGCFKENTLISTPNGEKEIQTLEKGDIVYAYDHKINQIVETEVEKLLIHEDLKDPAALLTLTNGQELYVTLNHPFPNVDIELKDHELYDDGFYPYLRLEFFSAGNKMFYLNQDEIEFVAIESIEDIGYFDIEYNLYLKDTNTFFANGLLVHNTDCCGAGCCDCSCVGGPGNKYEEEDDDNSGGVFD
jgi:cysteine-rich repeat protein